MRLIQGLLIATFDTGLLLIQNPLIDRIMNRIVNERDRVIGN
jgi:hypothetical protein